MEQFVNMASLSRTFKGRIKKLEGAEATVKDVLGSLSRDTLAALHEHGNITFINSLIKAKLTPMNRKTLVLFFRAFAGFHYEAGPEGTAGEFTKKQKTAKAYDEKKAAALAALADPDWDIWVWAEANVEPEEKGWSPESVTKYINSALKKVEPKGKYAGKFSRADILAAVFAAGVDIGEVMELIHATEQKAA